MRPLACECGGGARGTQAYPEYIKGNAAALVEAAALDAMRERANA